MPPSKGVSVVNDILRENSKEILIPFPAVKSRYGSAVVSIIDQLNASNASEAKGNPPENFKWFLAYIQPEDPDTTSEKDFTKFLIQSTRVFLVCRGFKWKGVIELNDVPQQIRNRYEERARLMCVEKKEPIPVQANASTEVNWLSDEINNIIASVTSLADAHSLDTGYVKIIRTALESLKTSKKRK